MTANDGQLFCSKPFTWFEVSRKDEVGDVFMCCPAWLDTPIGNLNTQSVDEIWNGPRARDIRRSILDGSFDYCNRSRCPFLQTVSGPVQRLSDVTDERLLAVIRDGLTVLPYGPREVNCCHDRSCNLSCPSCRVQIIVESQNRTQILAIQQKINDQALIDADLLSITGSGDPFGSPFFRRWLRTMKRADMPKLTRIHLHTNAQLWTPRMWETIPEEIRALVRSTEISIDAATPETYAINRRGGKFDGLLQNLEFISSLRAHGPIEWMGISMVVQENNFAEMPEFVRLGKRFGVDTVYVSQLVNWGTYSEDEFASRAIHFPSHPRHHELVAMLQDPIFDDPIVYLGNLTDVK